MYKTGARPWLVSGFLTVFFVSFALAALGFSPPARVTPLAISIPGSLLALLQFRRDLRATRPWDTSTTAGPEVTNTPRMAAWLTLLVSACILVGVVPGCGLFIASYMRLQTQVRLTLALAAAGLFCGAVYLLFTILLRVRLHGGVLQEMLLS